MNSLSRFSKSGGTKSVVFIGLAVLLVVFVLRVFGSDEPSSLADPEDLSPASSPEPIMEMGQTFEATEEAVLAGGCFWGVEAVFERLEGVVDVVSGYSGGDEETASYYMVGSGRTGHAESVRILYDPEIVDFDTLLEVFFRVAHDPTQLNYQGPDRGTEYRSVVFYANEDQRQLTEKYIDELNALGIFEEPIVTEVVALDGFYAAEDYHQDFVKLNPYYPYVVYWDLPKIRHLEEEYTELLKESDR